LLFDILCSIETAEVVPRWQWPSRNCRKGERSWVKRTVQD